jgi:CHAT domain-containing protein
MEYRQRKTIVWQWFRFGLIFSLIFSFCLGDLSHFSLVNLQPGFVGFGKADAETIAMNSEYLGLPKIDDFQPIKDLQDSSNVIRELKNKLESLENSVLRSRLLKQMGEIYLSLAMTNYLQAKSSVFIGDEQEAKQIKKMALKYDYSALNYFQKSIDFARNNNDKLTEIQALFLSISVAQRLGLRSIVKVKLEEAQTLLYQFQDSSKKVYLAIKLSQLIQEFPNDLISPLAQCPKYKSERKAAVILNQAIKIARNINDIKALSFALGNLGHFYECQNDYKQALRFTQQSLLEFAKNPTAYNRDWEQNLYLWHWQTGRIFKAEKNIVAAIQAYEQAISILTLADNDYSNLYNIGDNKYDIDELIYRELLELRIQIISKDTHEKQRDLNILINTINCLKQIELGNYFSQNFTNKNIFDNQENNNSYPRKIENIHNLNSILNLGSKPNFEPKLNDSYTAVFTSIIFPERIVIIVSLPSGEKRYDSIKIESENLRQQIKEFRVGLEDRGNPVYYPKQGQLLYNWIIRPFEAELEKKHIKTLVFVQDGILRSIPMSALHDGKNFLMEKYAIANTLSLPLTDTTAYKRKNMRVLALGITKDAVINNRKYDALRNVSTEINQVIANIPNSKYLLDEKFTRDRIISLLRENFYPIIHIATHGEFSSSPEKTFLITGNNEKLTIPDIENLIGKATNNQQKVELLTLTACQSAIESDRTALGFAGVAVQAGVKSAIASLWSIDDAGTAKLISRFYKHWHQNGMSKAQALQKAQQELMSLGGKYTHPFYWAPYILVGNWL